MTVVPAARLTVVERQPVVTVATLLEGWAAVLAARPARPARPSDDSIAALTVNTYGAGSVSLAVDDYRAFLHWACWLGLAFTRVHSARGFVLAARGPVSAGGRQLQIHLSCTHLEEGFPS